MSVHNILLIAAFLTSSAVVQAARSETYCGILDVSNHQSDGFTIKNCLTNPITPSDSPIPTPMCSGTKVLQVLHNDARGPLDIGLLPPDMNQFSNTALQNVCVCVETIPAQPTRRSRGMPAVSVENPNAYTTQRITKILTCGRDDVLNPNPTRPFMQQLLPVVDAPNLPTASVIDDVTIDSRGSAVSPAQ